MSSFSQRMMGYVAWLGSVSWRLLSTVHCVHYIGYSHPHLTFRHSRLRTLSRGCGGSWTQRCTHTHTPNISPSSPVSQHLSPMWPTPWTVMCCTLVCAIYSHSKTDSPQASHCIRHCSLGFIFTGKTGACWSFDVYGSGGWGGVAGRKGHLTNKGLQLLLCLVSSSVAALFRTQ